MMIRPAQAVCVAAVLACLSLTKVSAAVLMEPQANLPTGNPLDNANVAAFFSGLSATHIDFEGPWSPPHPTPLSFHGIGPVGGTYNSIGVNFSAGVDFAGGQSGFGWLSANTIIESSNGGFNGPIELTMVQPSTNIPASVPAMGIFIADGPTNDVTVRFYDLSGALLGSITPGPGSTNIFVAFSHLNGIHRMVATTAGSDDYYLDGLVFGRPMVPGPLAGLAALPLLGMAWRIRRRGA